VRYLAQGSIGLVREALRERGILLTSAPHLVHARDFVVPAYRWLDLPYYGIGLKLYDQLAGQFSLRKSRWLNRAEVIGRVPTVRAQGLRGGIVYTDGQFDDARLAITLALSLADLGGGALNFAPVAGFAKRDGQITGLLATDLETGEEFHLGARAVINATGVYVDEIRRLDDAGVNRLLSPSQGAHLVLDRSFLPGESALMVPRTDDGRVLFAIPWYNRALVGTTDTPIVELPLEPRPFHDEVAFLLDHLARYLDRAPRPGDILSTFAGLRPLLRGKEGSPTAKLSREHAVVVSESGLVTIAGGKWTTYRQMAIDAVDQAARVGGLAIKPSTTAGLKLHGWRDGQSGGDGDPGENGPLSAYGSDAPRVIALCQERSEWNQPLHPALPYRAGEVVWAARVEAARTVGDVLARRTRSLFLDARASVEAAPGVAAVLAAELARDQAWQDRQVAEFRRLAATYLPEPH
jgi:glycerol-3-phosphate dehydrogenase